MGNLFNIQGQVVVITGGLGVLGRGIATYLAGEGARVVILGRKAEEGDRLVTEIKAAGGEALFLLTDVMNRELLEQNREAILSKYGRIDTLLNAAGGNMKGATIPPDQTFLDLKLEDFRQVVDLNLFGSNSANMMKLMCAVIVAVTLAIPAMREYTEHRKLMREAKKDA